MPPTRDGEAEREVDRVRLDVWLDVSCLFKTRSDAQKACNTGRVEVNGQRGKPHRLLRVGDEVRITRPRDRPRILMVRGLSEHHVSKAAARGLYEDLTPPPKPEQIEARRLERLWRISQPAPTRAPDKRERRALRRLRGRL